jgi:hypothetical protein
MSRFDPQGATPYVERSRLLIALAIAFVFGSTVVLAFVTFWSHQEASKEALAVLSAVIGVLGAVTGYYFAKD